MPVLKDVMTGNLITAKTDDTIETLAKKMEEHDIGDLPIIENDKLTGVVTDRDIIIRGLAKGAQPGNTTAKDVMTDQVVTAAPDADVKEGIQLMGKHQIKRLFVAENDEVLGVVSIKDLVLDEETKQMVDDVEKNIKE